MALRALASLISASLLALAPSGTLGAVEAAPPVTSLDLTRATVQPLAWHPSAQGRWLASLELDGRQVVLDLGAASVRTHDFTLLEHRDGHLAPVAAPPVTTHRGVIIDRPGSLAAVSFVDGGVRAVITPGDGSLWYVQPRREIDPAAAPGDHVVYRSDAVRDTGRTCGGALPVPDGFATPPGTPGPRANCLREADLALDLDFTYYQHHGLTTAGAIADAESIVNGMNVIYNRDVNVSFKIGTTIVRTDATLYNTSDIGTLLGMIQSEWTTTQSSVTRDVAHLFTGQPTGGVIGLAWVDVICNFSYEYAVSNVDFTGDYASRVGLVSHEVGHNLAAGHCDGAPDCSIMCSGIGGCAGNLSGFSETSVGSLRYAAARYCLKDIGPAAAPGGPGAIANSYTITSNAPVRFDVLSNDDDPNCDTLSFFSFDTTSYAGATVSLSVGTGPGGRNELLYTPRADAAGYDTFLYTIADPAGAQATARVYVSNQTLREADNAGHVLPGLGASYYRAGGKTALPEFALLSPYKTATVPAINYPRAFNNIAGSGKSSNVGIVYTGQIIIPIDDTYTFFLSSEDGSMLFIDGAPVVSNDFVHNMTPDVSGAVALTAGPHDFRVEFFSGSSMYGGIVVSWQRASFSKQVIPASAFVAPGLHADYYTLPAALSQLPSFAGRTPYKTSVAAQLNEPSSSGLFMDSERADEILASFDGYFVAPTQGSYTFFTESDDGSRLYLGSNTVVNNDGLHGMVEIGGTVQLKPGTHKLRVEFFENGGAQGLIARVQGPGIDKQVIPASMLVHTTPCPSDFNDDGFVNGEDFDAFVLAFVLGDIAADFDDNSFVNGDDFDNFVLAFEAGC